MEQKRNEREAVDAIRAAGGMVRYDYQYDPSGKPQPNALPNGPDWLRGLLGNDFFSEVDSVYVYDQRRCREILSGPIQTLTNLRRLHLISAGISDDNLDFVAHLSHLKTLDVRGYKVTDLGQAKICKFARIANAWSVENKNL
jgi:hypothetical protein